MAVTCGQSEANGRTCRTGERDVQKLTGESCRRQEMHRRECAKDRCSKEIVFSRLSFQEDIFGEENLTCMVFCTNRTDVKIRSSEFSQ